MDHVFSWVQMLLQCWKKRKNRRKSSRQQKSYKKGAWREKATKRAGKDLENGRERSWKKKESKNLRRNREQRKGSCKEKEGGTSTKEEAERENCTRSSKLQVSAADGGLQLAEISFNRMCCLLGSIWTWYCWPCWKKNGTNYLGSLWEKDALQLPLYW